jgi:putative endonuclease
MHEEKHPAVYILASRYRGTLYVGVTSSLWQRVWDHKNGRFEGFTKAYAVKSLVWYEHHVAMENAVRHEKQLKKWNRAWKIELIEAMNPDWRDLHENIDVTATLVASEAGPPLSRG